MSTEPTTDTTVLLATPTPALDGTTTSEAAQACAEPKARLARLNANIQLELHTALKVRAAMEETTIGALLEEWIASWAHKK